MQVATSILGLLSLLAMPGLCPGVSGTTLTAPWAWALVSGFVVLGVALPGASNPLLNYSAAVTTLLPAAAIYGAKRPQHRGWQLIVAALLVMLLLPVGDSWFLGVPFNLAAQPLRSWFLVVLLAVQWGNWSVTRNIGPVSLLTAAQATMLWPQLPWGSATQDPNCWLLGAALLSPIPWWLVPSLRFSRDSQDGSIPSENSFDNDIQHWKNFRDAFGVVWALRVIERINEVAKLRGWSWRWSWSGPVPHEVALPGNETTRAMALKDEAETAAWRQLWANIFRRFLDPASLGNGDSAESHSQEANA